MGLVGSSACHSPLKLKGFDSICSWYDDNCVSAVCDKNGSNLRYLTLPNTTDFPTGLALYQQSMAFKPLFHSSQKLTRKLAVRTFIQSQYLKGLAVSLRVGFCDEWKRGLIYSTSEENSLELCSYIKGNVVYL